MAINAIVKFLTAARSLVDQGLSKEAIEQFARNEFGEINELFQKQIDNLFKPKQGIENIKIKDEVFDDTVIKLPIDDTGVPFNPNDPLKQYGKPKKEEGIKTIEGQMEKINKASSRLDELIKEREAMFKPKKTDDEIVQDLVDEKFGKGYFDTVKDPPTGFQTEKFIRDFPVTREEAERIAKLPNDERKIILQKYIDEDMSRQITLMDYDPPKGRKPNAEGGIAGFYTGGMVDVEPNLSDIGHGSDALMARTRLMSPGSQATTSTGLNYLLAEDNDNIRVPFSKGKLADAARRSFLKKAGAAGAGIAALKSGIIGLGKEAAPMVEAATETIKQAPSYFFDLANTIKMFGKKSKVQIQDRVDEYFMPSKDGKSELMLTEDVGTGEMQIKKIGKENDEMVSEVQTMEYSPGLARADEGGVPADDYQEYTEYNSRIYKDEFNDPDVVDGINVEDITKELIETKTKKASGGIARMIGE